MTATTYHAFWLAVGFIGQAVFMSRFLVQWIASERQGQSVVPLAFWWLSLLGGVMLLMYGLYRLDPVIIFGQNVGLLVYVRNLMLVRRAEVGSSRPAMPTDEGDAHARRPAARSGAVHAEASVTGP